MIRAKPGASVINLHKFWDDLIIGSENARGVRNRAVELRLRKDFARECLAELGDKRFENWVKLESFKVAKDVAYRNGQMTGSPDASKAPVLPDDYIPQAKVAAERRMVLAGYRLAELLNTACATER
jgi:hypothetical protein